MRPQAHALYLPHAGADKWVYSYVRDSLRDTEKQKALTISEKDLTTRPGDGSNPRRRFVAIWESICAYGQRELLMIVLSS